MGWKRRLLKRMVMLLFTVGLGLTVGLMMPSGARALADDVAQTDSGASANAAQIFENNCAGCHVNGGNIVRRGKNLQQKTLEKNGFTSVEAIAQLVTYGKNNMSAYGDRLSPEDIQAVSAYVLERAAQGWR